MIIVDILKYFAQFPLQGGVLNMFSNGRSDIAGYTELLSEMKTMPKYSRLPQITNYVFGENNDSVKSRVLGFDGTFLYVDYGELHSQRDKVNSIEDTFKMAVTIATKISSTLDHIELAIISDTDFFLIKNLIQMLLSDQTEISWLKEISKGYSIVPFDAPDWNAFGWTLLFDREGKDMLDIKSM